MLRVLPLLLPALGLATALTAQSASARPIVTTPPIACDGDCDDRDNELDLEFCFGLEVGIDEGACFDGGRPTCIDSCAQQAAETCGPQLGLRAREQCEAKLTRSCERSCVDTVGALCQPRCDIDIDIGCDDDNNNDSDVFVQIFNCIKLELD